MAKRKPKGKEKRKAKGLKHSKRMKATRQTKATKPKKLGGHGTRRSAARKPKQEAYEAAHTPAATEEVLDTTDSNRDEDHISDLTRPGDPAWDGVDKENDDSDDIIDTDGDRSR